MASRESLAERSRRFLSAQRRALFAGTDERKESSSEVDGSPEQTTSAYAKRRGQIRKAQKIHRDKKARYVEALEHEIVFLRTQFAAESQQLHDEVTQLRAILAQHGIAIKDPLQQSPKATVSITVSQGTILSLQVQTAETMAQASTMPSWFSMNRTAATEDFGGSSAPGPSRKFSSSPHQTSLPFATHVLGSSASVTATYGINFVLSLEHPCMQHPQVLDPEQEHEGHMLMASTTLFTYAEEEPQVAVAGPPKSWQCPESQLEKLLTLSRQVNHDTDCLTPVEVWHQVVTGLAGQKPELRLDTLNRVRIALMKVVHCKGFGAVVDVSDLRRTMSEMQLTYST